ncbi:hypothetical protein HN451_05945 [archaeon]|jgi:hypothetical protein|nr:hypothetical protein [archaeon]
MLKYLYKYVKGDSSTLINDTKKYISILKIQATYRGHITRKLYKLEKLNYQNKKIMSLTTFITNKKLTNKELVENDIEIYLQNRKKIFDML